MLEDKRNPENKRRKQKKKTVPGLAGYGDKKQ